MCTCVWSYCYLLVHHAISDDWGDSEGFDAAQGYARRVDGQDDLGLGIGNLEIALLVNNNSFGYFCFAFLAAQIIPLCLQLAVDEGIAVASRRVVVQILTLSPLYFVFQSKIVASFLTSEILYGGAGYIDAGRGLGSTRNRFVQLYSTFAPTCIYDGAELALFTAVSCIAGGLAARQLNAKLSTRGGAREQLDFNSSHSTSTRLEFVTRLG